ncbi:MAG: hypothetical protein RCG15_02740 [Candidatus Rickettsia vulgarisii]
MIDYTKIPDKDSQVKTDKKDKYSKLELFISVIISKIFKKTASSRRWDN